MLKPEIHHWNEREKITWKFENEIPKHFIYTLLDYNGLMSYLATDYTYYEHIMNNERIHFAICNFVIDGFPFMADL